MDAHPVVVGVDGGPDSLKALAWAAEYASSVGAPLIALAAVETPAVVGPYAMAGWVDPSILEERARAMLADAVRDTLGDDARVDQTAGASSDIAAASSKPHRAVNAALPVLVLVGGVLKGKQVVKLNSDTRIDEGDVVALFCLAKDVPEVERLLQVSIDFF